eukprot:9496203-Pyramimonas_sp.AAC.1
MDSKFSTAIAPHSFLGLPTSRFALREARSANNFALSRRPPRGRKGGRGGGGEGTRTAKRE